MNYFCGWYFKCQSPEHTLAMIPAVHTSGGKRTCSIQLISDEGNWAATLPCQRPRMEKDKPCAVLDGSVFREDGIHLSVHTPSLTAEGAVYFGPPTAIRYDIMGPFRYVPFMECRHSVFSMRHRVDGKITVNGTEYCFADAVGYIEGDRGRSFPRRYAWTQCCFPGGSLMLSVAEIPLGPVRFTGVIGVVWLGEKEYRLATYLGARTVKIQDGEIVVRQGNLSLTAALLEKNAYPLRAPVSGQMERTIRESVTSRARYLLSEGGAPILEFETRQAAFEYEF